MSAFEPRADWLKIETIDAHTAGEPLRVITSGFPEPVGETVLAKRRDTRERFDHLRRAIMLEPRGHADMYGCLLTAPVTPDGDVGVLFLHNEGYSTMCGHGIIGLVTVGLECGLIAPAAPPVVRIDTPAGRVTAHADLVEGRVRSVSFDNVASFVVERELVVEVAGIGAVMCDVAFGGAFYAFVDATKLGVALEPGEFARVVDLGGKIKRAVAAAVAFDHPEGDPDLGFLYGTIFCGRGAPRVHSRHVCVFADGEVDRCPTGTGVSARAAILHARGELELGASITIDSIIGTTFEVAAIREVAVGPVRGVVPQVTGAASLTGRHEFWVDPNDPLGAGFLLR